MEKESRFYLTELAKANVFGIRRQEKQWIDERQSIAWSRPMLVEYLHVSNEQPLTVKKNE